MHGLSDEAIFRLELDVRRLNAENRELRRRLKLPLNGLAVTIAVDNSVTQRSEARTLVTDDGNAVTQSAAALTPAEKQRRYRERQAALKNKNSTTDITA